MSLRKSIGLFMSFAISITSICQVTPSNNNVSEITKNAEAAEVAVTRSNEKADRCDSGCGRSGYESCIYNRYSRTSS